MSTDSRSISGGELFFALKGENFDGNKFAPKALEAGAAYAVVSEDSAISGDKYIPVPDTLATLMELARYHREHVLPEGRRLPVIGLTGTNGKTTTKELIREVLSTKYKVTATVGNLNNDIGVPLSVLSITPETEIAVIEMGASHPDDIDRLVKVCAPDFGLITNVGTAHILGFGSFEGVKRAKGSLYDFLSANGGTIFLNADDAVLSGMAAARKGLSIIPYGVDYWNAMVLPSDDSHPFLRMAIPEDVGSGAQSENLPVLETHLVGAYNAANALAAIAIGLHFGVSLDDAMAAIAAYEPANKRSQMVRTERNILIVDAYNANPSSMAAALANFANVQSTRKVALLGSMGELGDVSLQSHIDLVNSISAIPEVHLVGEEFRKALAACMSDQDPSASLHPSQLAVGPLQFMRPRAATGPDPSRNAASGCLYWHESSAALAEWLRENPISGATILVKGSRSQEMERVIPEL